MIILSRLIKVGYAFAAMVSTLKIDSVGQTAGRLESLPHDFHASWCPPEGIVTVQKIDTCCEGRASLSGCSSEMRTAPRNLRQLPLCDAPSINGAAFDVPCGHFLTCLFGLKGHLQNISIRLVLHISTIRASVNHCPRFSNAFRSELMVSMIAFNICTFISATGCQRTVCNPLMIPEQK
jgi:hypothetical protein